MQFEPARSSSRRLGESGMSYKFQRLRERIRQAVASGELSGKLPGERELARRFHVNAKTLSKALTDLAAEGLLHRSIGRGTFVRTANEEPAASKGPWLVLSDAATDPSLIQHLQAINPLLENCTDVSSIRPSFLNQFSAVVDLAAGTPEAFIRDLLVRGIPVVAVGQEQRKYSVNGVMFDSMLGASQLTRQLVLGGHRHFLAIEERARIIVAETIRKTAARYCQDFSVDACSASDVSQAAGYGATVCICDSVSGALRTLESIRRAGVNVPEQMSVAAIGCCGHDYPCTGYFLETKQQAAAIADILTNGQPARPVTLWLTGTLIDRGTTTSRNAAEQQQPFTIPVALLGQTAILMP